MVVSGHTFTWYWNGPGQVTELAAVNAGKPEGRSELKDLGSGSADY